MGKKVLLSGYFGFKNFGDELILSILINKLKTLNSDITVITSDPDYTKFNHNSTTCVRTFDILNIIKAIHASDILISGGGSLLQDVTSFKSLIYYLLIIFIALIFRKRVIIFAQGIGPINNFLGQILAKNILKHCDYISVRDEKSANLLKIWGIDADIVCDPVFCYKIEPKAKDKIIGIQLRSFKGIDDYTLAFLATFVSKNFPTYKVEIYSLQDSLDLDICKKFEQKINFENPAIDVSVFSAKSINDIIKHIGCCEYLIGMRFHSLIIGLLSGCKCLAINYDIKVENLAKEFNIPYSDLDFKFSKTLIDNFIAQDLETTRQLIAKKEFNWSKIEQFF